MLSNPSPSPSPEPSGQYPQEIVDYVIERTLIRARQTVRRVYNIGEVGDVQQDLLEDVFRRLPKFDGERADIKTFISRVIDNKVSNMIDQFWSARHSGEGRGPSLDDWVLDEDGEWTRRHNMMDANLLRAHRGTDEGMGERRGDQEMANLKADVAAVMAKLPPELRELCVRLQTQTPHEIIRQTGKARDVVYKQIAEIREAFTKAELHHYQNVEKVFSSEVTHGNGRRGNEY
ncbi:MAG: hypothetical protein FWD61_13980 [Phycisphaerales bacterium]|nr:hypothetical protein [Phycisphaerales bacterium]